MALLLDREAALPIRKVPRVKMWQDGLLEHLPHILRSHIKTFLDLTSLDVLFLHLLMILADLVQCNLVLIEDTVLADLPKGNGSDGVYPHIQLRSLYNPFAHLYHGTFFVHLDLALPADPDDDVFGLHDRHEVYLELEDDVHFLDEVLPVLEGKTDHLRNVELFEVIFLLEAGGVDGISCHVLDR